MSWAEGGCHCAQVRFRVRIAERQTLECNCSVCTKKGFLHLIVACEDFEIVRGREALTTYTFGTGIAQHTFCSRCGVHPFYVPRSHPEGFDVNVRCLDEVVERGLEGWQVETFDGRHWEDSVERIR